MAMIKKNIYSVFCLLLIFISGCETPISLTIPNKEDTKVIEGWIENDQTATVVISRSIPYTSKIDLNAIYSSVDTAAIVRVSDDMGNTEQLQLGFSVDHIYGVLGKAYVGKTIKGIPGHTYTLYVESQGKIYTAKTIIPVNTVQVDSFALFRQFTDTTATLRIFFTDRAHSYDCYRFFLKLYIPDKPNFPDSDLHYAQIFSGTFDDLTFNGLSVSYEMLRNSQSNLPFSGMTQAQREDYYRSTFRKGDVIHVKSTLTDKATQDYWFPLQTDISMGMNPFLTPGTYPTNIEGENVSGIWSGYNATYDILPFDSLPLY